MDYSQTVAAFTTALTKGGYTINSTQQYLSYIRRLLAYESSGNALNTSEQVEAAIVVCYDSRGRQNSARAAWNLFILLAGQGLPLAASTVTTGRPSTKPKERTVPGLVGASGYFKLRRCNCTTTPFQGALEPIRVAPEHVATIGVYDRRPIWQPCLACTVAMGLADKHPTCDCGKPPREVLFAEQEEALILGPPPPRPRPGPKDFDYPLIEFKETDVPAPVVRRKTTLAGADYSIKKVRVVSASTPNRTIRKAPVLPYYLCWAIQRLRDNQPWSLKVHSQNWHFWPTFYVPDLVWGHEYKGDSGKKYYSVMNWAVNRTTFGHNVNFPINDDVTFLHVWARWDEPWLPPYHSRPVVPAAPRCLLPASAGLIGRSTEFWSERLDRAGLLIKSEDQWTRWPDMTHGGRELDEMAERLLSMEAGEQRMG